MGVLSKSSPQRGAADPGSRDPLGLGVSGVMASLVEQRGGRRPNCESSRVGGWSVCQGPR